jgi:hypothetical protein
MRKLIYTLATFAALSGCYPELSSQSDSTFQAAEAKQSLPITGTWRATQFSGFTLDDNGHAKPLRAGKSQLNPESWRLKFDLDSQGDGLISGKIFCRTKAGLLHGVHDNLVGSRVLLTANGIVGGIHLIASAIDIAQCMASENGFIEAMTPVSRSSNFVGQPDPRLAKNIGFAGEGVSSTAAENECKKLLGLRFINVNKSSACVGFRDGSANRIRFIAVPPGAIYAVRVDFERD